MAAQVEAVALQALVKGSPAIQVEAFTGQALVRGTPNAQVEVFGLQVIAAQPAAGPVDLTGAVSAVQIAAPAGAVDASSAASDAALTGAVASVTVDAPAGAVEATAGAANLSLTGQAAAVTVDAPAGTVTAGSSIKLTGNPAPVQVAAPAGQVEALTGVLVEGNPARVTLTAPPGKVFAGTLPSVVEAVRVPGPTGTTFTVPFTKPILPGDTVVIAYAGYITPLGSDSGAFTVSGLGGTWDATVGDILTYGTEVWWAVSTDAATTGNVTVTVTNNRDPLLVGLLIRGTDGQVTVNRANARTIYANSGIGQVFIALAAKTASALSSTVLDMVNYATRPTEADWTEVAPYTGANYTRQVAYAVARDQLLYLLDPGATTGSANYNMEWISVGTPTFDATLLASSAAKVTVTAPAGRVVVDSPLGETVLGGAGSLTVTDLKAVVSLGEVTLTGAGRLSVDELTAVTTLGGVTLGGAGSLTALIDPDTSTDPRTAAHQWRYVLTTLTGTPLGELVDVAHDPVEDGVNTPTTMSLTLAVEDPARALIEPVVTQCQVWQGNRLLLRGPVLPGIVSDDGATITHTIHDPSWYWRDGRKRIGRVPKLNLLRNGDFAAGMAYWTPGFDPDSIPKAAPKVAIVTDDVSDSRKAVQIAGVETVTTHVSELAAAAVYWPNRPYADEPLSAGFRPGGEAAVDKVAQGMPSTAGLKVTIVGHTANDGTGNGMELSLRRAQAAAARVKALRPGAVITTKGVGFYDPNPKYPIDSQAQRRVVISYAGTSTVDAAARQWIRQTVTVTQPKEARYGLDVVGAAWLKVTDDWDVPDASMTSVRVVARRTDKPKVIWQEASGQIADTDPINRWMKQTATVTIPADGRPYFVDVYLYAPAALARYAIASLEPQEELYFWGDDQALIVKGIIEHMQDPITMAGHTWPITVGTRTPLTGVVRDREYRYSERMPIDTALEEWPSLYRGMDVAVLTTETTTTVATFYPRQGGLRDYQLVLGGNLLRLVPASTRDVASLVISQAQDSSAARDESYALDANALGGLLLQRLVTAEQETPVRELDELAAAELALAKVATPSYWVDVDPDAILEVMAHLGKGDTCRLIADGPEPVDAPARVMLRQIHPDSLRLLVSLDGD